MSLEELPLEALQIPADFLHHDRIVDSEVISHLEEWKISAIRCLSDLHELVIHSDDLSNVPLKVQAKVISHVAAFDGRGPWTCEDTRRLTNGALYFYCSRESDTLCLDTDILIYFSDPKPSIIEYILQYFIKPVFLANPHPSLNLSTGRKLLRMAGGPMATQDYYEAQTWKCHPGVPNILSWCVRNVKVFLRS